MTNAKVSVHLEVLELNSTVVCQSGMDHHTDARKYA